MKRWNEYVKRKKKNMVLSSRSCDTATPLSNVMFDISRLCTWTAGEPQPRVCEIYNQSFKRREKKKNNNNNKWSNNFSPFAVVIDEHMFKCFSAARIGAKSVGASSLQHTFTRHGLDFNQMAETTADALVQLWFHPWKSGPVIGLGNIWPFWFRAVIMRTNLNRHTYLVLSSSALCACLCTSASSLFHPLGKQLKSPGIFMCFPNFVLLRGSLHCFFTLSFHVSRGC